MSGLSDQVGWVFTFWVDPAKDAETEQVMREIFDAMAEEEFPNGEVITYTAYRVPEEPGKWVMFEHFTQQGSDQHAKGPKLQEIGAKLTALMVQPYTRMEMQPVLTQGCGEPIAVRAS